MYLGRPNVIYPAISIGQPADVSHCR